MEGHGKKQSKITAIYLNEKSFSGSGTIIHPSYVNYFYGSNGTGKSTIAKAIESHKGLVWANGCNENQFNFLVYNQDFITRNLREFDSLPGVFSISEENNEIQDQIDSLNRQKNEVTVEIQKISEDLKTLKSQKEQPWSTFCTRVWDLTKDIRDNFPKAVKYRNDKAKFATEITKVVTGFEADIEQLLKSYETLFAEEKTYTAFQYPPFNLFNVSEEESKLLLDPVQTRTSSQFAEFLKKIDGLSWIRDAHERFHEKTDGVCPYCQQPLPYDFESDLMDCFDQTYEETVATIRQFGKRYKNGVLQGLDYYKNIPPNLPESFDKESYKDKLSLLTDLLNRNLHVIKDKVYDPSKSLSLEDSSALVKDLNGLIGDVNIKINQHNELLKSKSQNVSKFKNDINAYLRFLITEAFDDYKNAMAVLQQNEVALNKKRADEMARSKELSSSIKELKDQVKNTQTTIDSMNKLLCSCGFTGFKIHPKENLENYYEVRRYDGSIVEALSEGEKNFIAFLYFFHLVLGGASEEDISKEKIVVIDDPVTSMDSSTMFTVSTLIKALVENCENNVVSDGLDGFVQGNEIKQIFIFTHNTFFHREVTCNQERHYSYVNFYKVYKSDNISRVKGCREERNEGLLDSSWKNYNPVKDSYAALWDEYKSSEKSVPTINIIRQILDYYFLQHCGYDSSKLLTDLIVNNKEKFIKENMDGSVDNSCLNQVRSMLAFMSSSSRSRMDSMNFIEDDYDVKSLKETFKMIFDVLGQNQHYQMMMES